MGAGGQHDAESGGAEAQARSRVHGVDPQGLVEATQCREGVK